MNPSDAVEIAQHYRIAIVAVFVVGYAVHVLMQIDAVARAKNNPINSRLQILEQNWIRLLGRFFTSFLVFTGFWQHPSAIATLIGYTGATLPPNLVAVLTLPMNLWFAGVWGYGVDSLLAYIPILKNLSPPIEGVQAQLLQDASVAIDKVTQQAAAVKEAVEEAKTIVPDPPKP